LDQAAPLRGAGSGAPRAVPNHGGQLIRTACMARKLGAAAGLLRRIRLCPSGPRVQPTLRVVGGRSALADSGPGSAPGSMTTTPGGSTPRWAWCPRSTMSGTL